MNSLRIARGALKAAKPAFRAAPALRRGYADVASDKIQLTLALPHQVRDRCDDLAMHPSRASSTAHLHPRGTGELTRTQAIYKSQDVYVLHH